MEERRGAIRVYTDTPMRYKHLGRDEAARISKLVNLGRTGLRFLCEEDFAGGDMLKLDFRLPPTAQTITASAKVIWTNHLRVKGENIYEVGLKFIDIDPEYQAAIQQFVKDALIAERAHRIKAYFVK